MGVKKTSAVEIAFLAREMRQRAEYVSAEDYQRLREGIDRVIRWCDERRDAPEWTTLGMVQQKLRDLLV